MLGTQVAARREFRVEGLAEPISHYTDAVQFGDTLYISGVSAVDESGEVVKGGTVAQTEKIFENMKKILDAAGADFSDILKVTVYMIDVSEREAVNVVRQKYFGDARPASTLIGIKELALDGMTIEIEAVAGLRPAAKKN